MLDIGEIARIVAGFYGIDPTRVYGGERLLTAVARRARATTCLMAQHYHHAQSDVSRTLNCSNSTLWKAAFALAESAGFDETVAAELDQVQGLLRVCGSVRLMPSGNGNLHYWQFGGDDVCYELCGGEGEMHGKKWVTCEERYLRKPLVKRLSDPTDMGRS